MHILPPHRLIRLSIALACILLVAAGVVAGWSLSREGSLLVRTPGPTVLDMQSAPRPSPSPPEALVGLSLRGSATPMLDQVPPVGWVKTLRKTPLQPRPEPGGDAIVRLPEACPLKVLSSQGHWLLVYYGGGFEEQAGEGWVALSDVTPAEAPNWVATRWDTDLSSGQGGRVAGRLLGGSLLELLEDRGRDLRVFYLGDGRSRALAEGWVKATDLGAAGVMLAAEGRGIRVLSHAEVERLRSGDGLWMKVPFRSQFDGSPAASANCGPASVGMALEFFGTPVPTEQLRDDANRLQGTAGPDVGFGIQHLAELAKGFGLSPEGLYAGQSFRKWDVEEVRRHLAQGHPVIPELRFRLMPGRSMADTWDDHYVVITGMQGDKFIYNDSVDSDAPGYARVMSTAELIRAWGGSDFPFAAFALSKP